MKLLPKRFTAWRRRGKASVANDLAFLSPEERKQLGTAKGTRKPAAKGTRKPAAQSGRFGRSR